MSYNPDTLMRRYQQMLDVGTHDATQTSDSEAEALGQCAWCDQDAEGRILAGDVDACQACCVGLVEMVRQCSEKLVQLETRSGTLDDTWTKAQKLSRP